MEQQACGQKRSADEVAAKYIWVQIKEWPEASEYRADGFRNVGAFLEHVHEKETLANFHVPPGYLRLYVNEAAKKAELSAIPRARTMADLLGEYDFPASDPAFIDYKEPPPPIAQAKPLTAIAIPEKADLVRESVLVGYNEERRQLLDRENQVRKVEAYIDSVVKQQTSVWVKQGGVNRNFPLLSADKKSWRVCATVAFAGMGKTALLEVIARRQQDRDGREALFVTFNTMKCVPAQFMDLRSGIQHAMAGALLYAAGVEPEDLENLACIADARHAIDQIRACRHMPEGHTLVVIVDELREVVDTKFREAFVSEFMRLQDRMQGKLVIVFSAFADLQFQEWTSGSGRELYSVPIGPLEPMAAVAALLQEIPTTADWQHVRDWLSSESTRRFVAILSMHPRSLFTKFVRCAKNVHPLPGSVPTVLSQVLAGDAKMRIHLADGKRLLVERLRGGHQDPELSERMEKLGLLRRRDANAEADANQTQIGSIQPILVRAIAYDEEDTGPERLALRAIFDADCCVTKTTRAMAELVVQYFQQLLRCVFGEQAITLQDMFRDGKVGDDLGDCLYCLNKRGSPRNTRIEANFRNGDRVRTLLQSGHIVVATSASESGIEHLVPLFDESGNSLAAVLAVQIKGGAEPPKAVKKQAAEGDTSPCDSLIRWALVCAREVVGEGTKIIPFLVVVSPSCMMAEAQVSRQAVQLIGGQVGRWLHFLMPLNTITAPGPAA